GGRAGNMKTEPKQPRMHQGGKPTRTAPPSDTSTKSDQIRVIPASKNIFFSALYWDPLSPVNSAFHAPPFIFCDKIPLNPTKSQLKIKGMHITRHSRNAFSPLPFPIRVHPRPSVVKSRPAASAFICGQNVPQSHPVAPSRAQSCSNKYF